jgi:hypothetical protein
MLRMVFFLAMNNVGLDIHSLDTGYLVIFNFNKNKEFKKEKIVAQGKEIFLVYV